MPSTREIREHVEHETARRHRLGVAAFASGFLYLLSQIVIVSAENGAPKVGLLQGLAPALSGEANPAVSPATGLVKFVSHHAFPLVAGGVLSAIAVGIVIVVLLVLLDAVVFRRPQSWPAARPFVFGGGVAWALANIAHPAILAVETHAFAVGHDHSITAANNALQGTTGEIVASVGLLGGVVFSAGMINTMLNALRTGLLVRWMAMLGMLVGPLLFLPVGIELQLVAAFWMVMMGLLYSGKWPNGDPPAWSAGEAIAWPPRGVARPDGSSKAGRPAPAAAGAASVPAPTPASGGSSRKRRRKR